MDRISGANYTTVGGLRMWQDRNQAAGIFGTFGNALWFNGAQESILAPVASAGLVPTDADNTQLLQAIKLIAGHGLFAYLVNGNYTWVAPAAWFDCNIMMIGAGGGGGAGGGAAGSGGSSGGLVWSILAVTPGSSWPIYVGKGGAGGINLGTAAQTGGSSGLGGVYATGGGGGTAGVTGQSVNSVLGGQGYGGVFNLEGSPGAAGISLSGGYLLGGAGASAPFTGGGPPSTFGNASSASSGFAAQAPGAGGSGACLDLNGGAGADGLVLIWR
jgi:hypothetical protein